MKSGIWTYFVFNLGAISLGNYHLIPKLKQLAQANQYNKGVLGNISNHHLSQTQLWGKCGSTQQKNHQPPLPRSPAGLQLLALATIAALMALPPDSLSQEEGPSHWESPLPAPGSYPFCGSSSLPLVFTANNLTSTSTKKRWICETNYILRRTVKHCHMEQNDLK